MTCTTDNIFDFLMSGKTVSLSSAVNGGNENKDEADNIKKNKTWILYTLNTESEKCPLDCLIISVTYPIEAHFTITFF